MNHFYHDPRDTNVFAEKRVLVKVSEKTIKRFWSKVVKREGNMCWEWCAGASNNYGVFYAKELNGMGLAHRAAFAISRGYLPSSRLDVCHDCDNPKCVRFDHLFLGTRKDNMRDMSKKGRHLQTDIKSHGELHYSAKLKEKDVHEIRSLFKAGGMTCFHISLLMGISDSVVRQIVLGQIWKHVKTEGWQPAASAIVRRKHSILQEEDIPQIRRLRKTGKSFSQIGKIFGVNGVTIFNVINKDTWAHVPDEFDLDNY